MTAHASKLGALIYGNTPHYLDHLAPLAALLEIPLIVTEEIIEKAARIFYPQVEIIYVNYVHVPAFIVQSYDAVIVCVPKALFDEVFFLAQQLHRKRVVSIWCPHGNSDKGHLTPYMEALAQEDRLLVYGDKMLDFIKQKKGLSSLASYLFVGNYRKKFYLKHKAFYDSLLQAALPSGFTSDKPILFYAPTWNDAESSSSYEGAIDSVISFCPTHVHLLIKPHPNLSIQPIHKEGVFVLRDFPPIYPIVFASEYYLGDFSSIGYDFLSVDKPMFFLNQRQRDPKKDLGLYLYQCGTEITPCQYSDLEKILEKGISNDPRFALLRTEVYDYTFKEESIAEKELDLLRELAKK